MKTIRLLLALTLLLLACMTADAYCGRDCLRHYAGENASYFQADCAFDEASLRSFRDFRLDYDEEAHAANLQVTPLADDALFAFNYYRVSGMRTSQKLVFRMRNLGSEPEEFHLSWLISREGPQVGTSELFCWTFTQAPVLPADGEWHEYALTVAEGSTVGGGTALSKVPLFQPFGKFYFWFGPSRAGVTKHIQIAEIRGEDDVACSGTLEWRGALPSEASAGGVLALPAFRAEYQGRAPLDPQVRLILRREGDAEDVPPVILEVPGIAKEPMAWNREESGLPLTEFLLDGEYTARLECGEAALSGAEWPLRILGRKDVGFRQMTVQRWKGRNTIHCDGRPVPGAMRATYTTEGTPDAGGTRGVKAFSDAGVRLFGFSASPTEGGYTVAALTEYAPGKYNYSQVDRRMRATLAANPEAMVVIRLYLHAPLWWSQANPDEVVCTGNPHDPEGRIEPLVVFGGRHAPSWASQAWRKYTADGIRHLVEFLQKSPYADHVAGFVLASGVTEEWMEWGCFDNQVADYSKPAREAFRRWLARKYGSSDELQEAWGDSAATLENATMPTPRERYADNYSGVRKSSAPGARRMADFYRFHSENVSECIQEIARAAKKSSGNRLLVGAFYGYFVEFAGSERLLNGGHLGVGRLLESPYLDFLCSPTGYKMRQVGGRGLSYAMGAAESLQLHNKFWFIENDIRTYDTPNAAHGRPDTPEGDVLQQTKETLHNLLSGMAQWWFDVGSVRFESPLLMDCIRKLSGVVDEVTLECSRESVAQVALVLDEAAMDWVTVECSSVNEGAMLNQRILASMGTPYEVYLAQDLENLPERIRLVFLPFCLQEDPEQNAALERLRAEGRTLFFLGTPGVIPADQNSTAAQAARRMTGLPLEPYLSPKAVRKITLQTVPGWIAPDQAGVVLAGSGWQDGPGRYLRYALGDEPGVLRLGVDENGRCALGVRPETEGGFTGFLGRFLLPKEILPALYQHAGVHRYVLSGDQVWASPDVVAVCVEEGGLKVVRLPAASRQPDTHARDMLTGETFPVDAEGVFQVEFEPLTTRVFRLE